MALPRRTLLGSLAVAIAGCTSRESPASPESSDTETTSPTTTAAPTTEPGYASCDPDLTSTEERHTAGSIPDPLGKSEAASYARKLEEDILLPPPEDRSDGYVSFGSTDVETVEFGYLVTVEVSGGYYNEADDGGTVTVHADLGTHIATYFVNEQVVRRAEDYDTELDPREQGEIVVCES